MRSFFSISVRLSVVAVIACSTACIVEEDSHHDYQPAPDPTYTVPTPTPTSTAPGPTNPPPQVSLDTGKTLTAPPGEGAGISVTYQAGGHWSLAWTCDTNSSGQNCAFDVSVTTSGLSNVAGIPQGSVVSQDSISLRAQTNTGATLDGVTFDVAPGGSVVLSATINGSPEPKLIYFVSDNQIREAPTNPLEFVPTAP